MSSEISHWLAALAPICGLLANAAAQMVFQRLFHGMPIVLSYAAGLMANLLVTFFCVFILFGCAMWQDYAVALITAGCFSFCYSNAVNLVYSSLRVRVLLWMSKSGGVVAVAELHGLCDGKAVVADRLARLEHWKQLRREGDQYRLTPGWMFALAKLFQSIKLLYFNKGFAVTSHNSCAAANSRIPE